MRHLFILLLWLLAPPDSLSVMCWNVENFFDWRNDSTTESDAEFSASGERHWTWKRFQAKANAFAKALLWVADDTGRLPDIIGLEEVENAFVLRQLLHKTALRKLDYQYVHYSSPDRRGIDVALLYRSSVLELVDSKPCHLYEADTVMATRDILLCVFKRKDSVIPGLTRNLFAVLINHHPSKYGGAAESEPRRRIAVDRLRFLADSLAAEGVDRIIAGGDFNDTPDNPVFHRLEPALKPLHTALFRRGEGTIKYDGKWDLIDHFYASPALLEASPSMRILRIPFLLTRDNAHSGEKPLRTYTGPRYAGGVSDHLPIIVFFRIFASKGWTMNKKNKRDLLSAAALVVIFAAWLIIQRTGLFSSGPSVPLVDLPDDQLELPAQRAADNIVTYQGYVSSYNTKTLIPNWVAYELTDEETRGDATRADKNFSMDMNFHGRQAMREDYNGSGWTRGHMAPAADFFWDDSAMSETFYFMNICPQREELNNKDWQYLEKRVRAWANKYGKVWVVSGPIIGDNIYGTIGRDHVVVPDAFFKVVLVHDGKRYQSIAFIMGNDAERYWLNDCALTVDELEQRTGYDFYPALPDDIEEDTESRYDLSVWGIRKR